MENRIKKRWSVGLISLVIAATLIRSLGVGEAGEKDTSDRFEMVRAYVQAWLTEADNEKPIISSLQLKEKIIDDWGNQSKHYQIVSVRKPQDYNDAGHIPNAINIHWLDILTDENLTQLDTQKTLILYCYYGHGSMISSTILSLLGYRCYSLDFGMMDWNLNALVKEAWDEMADFEVEADVNSPNESYPAPSISSDQTNVRAIIKETARKYLASEGSPIIRSKDVKAILDDWDHNKDKYQIVDVRSTSDYEAGHIPNAVNIQWAEIAGMGNLLRLDPRRTVIVCSDNGQTGQLAATVLNILGYHSVNLLFGMADWNREYINSHYQWDGVANYPVASPK